MTPRTLAALAAALVGVAAPSASGRTLPLCLTFADAKGDAGPAGVTAAGDPSLDVTKVRFATVDGSLVAQVTVAAFADRALLAPGNRYQVNFDVAGRRVEVYWRSGPLREHESAAAYQQGVRVDDTFAHDSVTGSVKGDTVSIGMTLAMLRSAVGSEVVGVRAESVRAFAMAGYNAVNPTWDTATGPVSGFVVGRACR